jgi:hypothetical protein
VFDATATTEVITFVGSNVGQVNAYQLRAIVPEPSAMILVGVGGLLVWRRMRK